LREKWEIKRLFVGPELGEFPLPQGSFVVTLDKGDGTHYSIGVKTANIFYTTIELMGKIEAFDAIKFPGGCAIVLVGCFLRSCKRWRSEIGWKELSGESSGLRFTVDFEKKCLSENF
jgi:hypothetical protein